jgi:23S rRNA (adenine2503-C2)-methyltransferase
MKELRHKSFINGIVYALETEDGYPIEVTDTFLPFYTKESINSTNKLQSKNIGSRLERWMIGVSCMSGCPVRCKFCATGQLKKWRPLSGQEIFQQVEFILQKHSIKFTEAKEHKINYTRMGEPFLNIQAIKEAITLIKEKYPNTHHYISTIGVKGSDFSWIKDNITLQVSLHSFVKSRRDNLIPYNRKLSIEELGQIRTCSNLKTTVNLTLAERIDFDIEQLKSLFDKEKFFIKLSPINPNSVSTNNGYDNGVVEGTNLL